MPKGGGSTQKPEKSASKQSSVGGSRPKVPDRVYALDSRQVSDATKVVKGMILVFHCLVKVLSDLGTTHSSANPKFMSRVDVRPIKFPYNSEVRTLWRSKFDC